MEINWSVLFIENNADLTTLYLLILTHRFHIIVAYEFYDKRAFEVCTNIYLEKEISLTKQIAIENGFPTKYINRLVDEAKQPRQKNEFSFELYLIAKPPTKLK